jgi:hypothetical protein
MINQRTACFNGCSFTVGEGFESPEEKDLYVYDRLVANSIGYNRINIAVPGSSNHRIFIRSVNAIEKGICDILFVQWSALSRIWLSPGPEAWYCAMPSPTVNEYVYRNKVLLKGKEKLNFEITLNLFNHDYNNILELVDYCNILSKLAKQSNVQIVYINGLVPWTRDLVTALTDDLNNSLSLYTKEILDFSSRDDDDIKKNFLNLQQKFSTMDLSQWVNVFDSLQNNMVDIGTAGHHPGIKSNQWIANKIIDFMKDKQQ